MDQNNFIKVFILFLNLSFCLSDQSFVVEEVDFEEKVQKYNPPPYKEKAKRARYLLHNIEWGAFATISSHYNKGVSPFSNIVAISDGPTSNSSGTPYMYVTGLDTSTEDAKLNRNVSVTVSEMETSYCKDRHYNAELPTCARLTLVGKFEEVTSPDEKSFALNALFSRFPAMKTWPKDHGFFSGEVEHRVDMVDRLFWRSFDYSCE